MTALEEGKGIILFDGVCNLCNKAVNFIIKRDTADRYRFAPLQSPIGLSLLAERRISSESIDSLVLIIPGQAYYLKSSSALKIGRSFGGLWKVLVVLEWIPRPIRDWFYDRVAENRYVWFGKRTECMVPSAGLQAKFLKGAT